MIKRLVPLLASAWMMVMAGCAPLADFPLLTLSPPPITPLPTLTPTTPPHIPDPNPVARTYLDAWQAEDYPAMYAWLTPLSQDAITLERFAAIHRNSAATMSLKTIGYEILSSLVKSQTAQIGYRITFDTILIGQVERDTIMALSLIGDQWRVQWDHAMIMPELAGGNTLWMEYRVPARGNIYDARGHALVAQTDAVSLGLIVGETDQQQEADLYHELWQLTGITPEAIRARVESYREGWYLPLAEVSAAQVEARLPALEGMTGLVMEPYRARYYFEGGIAPHVLGYVSQIDPDELEEFQRRGYQQDERVGRMGLEKWGESYLAGDHGGVLYVVDPDGNIITKVAESNPAPAQAIYTTLHKDLQLEAQNILREFTGAIVVMERDTGRVLVMASSPGFDPNLFEPSNYNSSYLLDDLLRDPNTPLLNRATQGQYPLGSVFKIVTMAAALESDLFTGDSTYYCGHTFTAGGSTRYDWTYDYGVPPSGLLTLPEGLMRSCNPWFWHIGLTLYEEGMENAIADMAEGFGLSAATGIEPVVESAGQIPHPETRNEAINNAIGQGDTLVTPLQVARFIAAIGNGGDLLRPKLVERIEFPNGEVTYQLRPEVMDRLPVSDATLDLLRAAMESVVANPRGTAYWRFINFPIPIAGKTGTAEAPPGEPHAWFAGYTFAERPDRPDLAIAVVLEHAGEGSVVAAPVFKRMLEVYYFDRPLSPLPWETDFEVQPPETGD